MGHDLSDEELRATRDDFFKKGMQPKIELKEEKMSKADKMFNKLGYKKVSDYIIVEYISCKKQITSDIYIVKNGVDIIIDKKRCCRECLKSYNVPFTKEEFVAIYEKMKEKEWIK